MTGYAEPSLFQMIWDYQDWTRRQAVHRLLKTVGPALREDHGHCGPYTLQQITSTLNRRKIKSRGGTDSAVAVFVDLEALEQSSHPDWLRLKELRDRIRRDHSDKFRWSTTYGSINGGGGDYGSSIPFSDGHHGNCGDSFGGSYDGGHH